MLRGASGARLLEYGVSLAVKPSVCAVSFLNTVPLVWGMLHGEQQGLFDLSFCLPSECAERLADGRADVGIVPVMEMARQGLDIVPGTGIACRGPVRSILLISKVPFERVRTLAADSSSRTSVELARIILARRFGAAPVLTRHAPDWQSMLAAHDACLVIGDPALRIDPAQLPYACLDLGAEWLSLTGLPMVFAVWAGRGARQVRAGDFEASYRFGAARIGEIAAAEHARRAISRELAYSYLTENIKFIIGPEESAGLQRFLEFAAALPGSPLGQGVAAVSR